MRAAYPSDVTRAQFEGIRHYFDTNKKKSTFTTYSVQFFMCCGKVVGGVLYHMTIPNGRIVINIIGYEMQKGLMVKAILDKALENRSHLVCYICGSPSMA